LILIAFKPKAAQNYRFRLFCIFTFISRIPLY